MFLQHGYSEKVDEIVMASKSTALYITVHVSYMERTCQTMASRSIGFP
jgi:hypothetical protein